MPDEPDSAEKYYVGEIAHSYTAARTQSPAALRKRNAEAAAVKSLSERLPHESLIADLPCGDGRFAALSWSSCPVISACF